MMKKNKLATLIGASVAASIAMAPLAASANPFSATDLSSGYENVSFFGDKGAEGKCGEGKCGDKKAKKEGKCGEGKCGDKKDGKAKKEGKCGEGKCGDKK